MNINNFTWPGYSATVEDQVLRDFLVLDIQANQRYAQRFLQAIQVQIDSDTHEQNENQLAFGGNMFLCKLSETGATIDLLDDAEDFGEAKHYSLEQLQTAVNAWIHFLKTTS